MTVDLSSTARSIAAKTDPNSREQWLPLHFHLLDTALTISRLFNNWLSPAARKAMSENAEEDLTARTVAFLAMIHDLGKATPAFQDKLIRNIEGALDRLACEGLQIPHMLDPGQSPHALAGEALLYEAGFPASIAAIIGAHHGRPTEEAWDLELRQLEMYKSNYRGRSRDDAWRKIQYEYIEWALRKCGFTTADEFPAFTIPEQMLLTGLLIMADWIASNTYYFPLIPADDPGTDYNPSRIDIAWKRLELMPGWESEGFSWIDGLCEKRFGFKPNALQKAVMDVAACTTHPGIIIIEAQMGVGKTEAALLAAELLSDGTNGLPRRGGIFFGLPTQATANGIFERVKNWGESQAQHVPATIRLAHNAADLNDAYAGLMRQGGHGTCIEADATNDEGLVVHEWFRGRKQALLSDFVVGTVDQLLMMALKQRHVMLRHLGMSGKVAIIDECHAYDAYMNRYLESALRWLGACHVPVILLSATLPSERRAALVDAYIGRRLHRSDTAAWRTCRKYPLLTWSDGGEVRQKAVSTQGRHVTIEIRRMDSIADMSEEASALTAYLSEALREGGCAGVIVNTVRRAQYFARELRERMPEFEIMLIHAQFILPDRVTREQEMLRRTGKKSTSRERDRLIVVGTQVCEQSLDLDFDILVSDLCPMDLLLQRMGRLHRHRHHDALRPAGLSAARCLVMGIGEVPDAGGAAVYGEYLLMRTRALLPQRIELPTDIPRLVQDTYDGSVELPVIPSGYAAAKDKDALERKKAEKRAGTFCLTLPAPSAFAGLNTIDGLLNAGLDTEEAGQRAVRDGDPSVDVLVLKRNGDDIGPLKDSMQFVFHVDHVPDERECRMIAMQKLRLPHALCAPWALDGVIDALRTSSTLLSEWQQSPWLRGESFLLLDERGIAKLDRWLLRYDEDMGLLYQKEEAHAED